MQKLLLIGSVGAFVCAALVYPIAGIIASGSTEAYLIAAHDPKRVSGEKEFFKFDPPKADEVIDIRFGDNDFGEEKLGVVARAIRGAHAKPRIQV